MGNKRRLLLNNRYNYSTNDIYKAAINVGWNPERIHDFNLKQMMEGYETFRYYGNTVQQAFLKDQLPIKFIDFPRQILLFQDYAKREVSLIKFEELRQPIIERKFIKPTYEKWFDARIYEVGETITGTPPHNDDLIYVSEIIDIIDEVRCFCLNGEILTSSYYRINKEVEMKPFDDRLSKTLIEFYVKELFNTGLIKGGIVLDFGRMNNNSWCFIEANEAWASGIYDCDPVKCLEVIVNSQIGV